MPSLIGMNTSCTSTVLKTCSEDMTEWTRKLSQWIGGAKNQGALIHDLHGFAKVMSPDCVQFCGFTAP